MGPARALVINVDSSSSDTSLILKCFKFGDREGSESSDLDWSVFDNDCADTANSAPNEASTLENERSEPFSRGVTTQRAPPRRRHGYRVRRSQFDALRSSSAFQGRRNLRGFPPGFNPDLGFSLTEWERIYPKLVESGIVMKEEPVD